MCPVHVGRDREIERLTQAAGGHKLTLIAGEAGAGKSRLAAEALRLASDRGLVPLVGYCTPDAGVPYAPFVTAIRRATRTLADDQLAPLFSGQALLASALLPEAARALGLSEQTPAKEEDLFAALWQLLARLSAPNGGLLLLEDLHWADTDSLRLLSYLAREAADLPVWLVGTYRSDELHRRHPLTAVLAELGRERRYGEIRLQPLAREDLRHMVSAILDDTEVGDEFLDAMVERTEGNPFFVEELISVLVDRGDIFRREGDWARRDLHDIEMPETVRETLLARVRTLDEQAQQILQVAALAGERVDRRVVGSACGVGEGTVDGAVGDGLRLQLLVERREGRVTTYGFRHALTREALADELVGPERQRAHQRVADSMRAVHLDDLDAVAAELAEHYAEAGDAAAAVEFGARAARLAAASFAMQEAGKQYERTLRLMESESAERLKVLLEAADALMNGPDPQLVLSFSAEAERLARQLGDPVSEGLALTYQQRLMWEAGDTPKALAVARRAYELVRGRDDVAEATVTARLIRMLVLSGEVEEAQRRLPAGIDLAERVGNHPALSLLQGSALITVSGYGPEFEHTYAAALDAARKGNDMLAELNLATNAGYVSIWTGHLRRASGLLVRAMELAEQYRPSTRYEEAGYAWLLSLTGEYDEAWRRGQSLRGVDCLVPTQIVALGALYEVAERRGDVTAGDLVVEMWSLAERTGETQRTVPTLSARARHALVDVGVSEAIPMFWEVLSATTTRAAKGSHWMFSPDLARALDEQEETSELERWVEAIGRLTDGDPSPHNLAAGALCGAYLEAARGGDAWRPSFERAAAMFEALPCPARQAEALLGLADHEYRAGRVEASAGPARQALALSSKIGATELARRARRAFDRAEAPPVLATVLFTDIVGSTEQLSAVGDRAWHSILERHNTLVRRELAQWKGHEVNTTGDGFVAWFDSPAQGIRCALALRHSLGQAGITVRAGLHTGECQVSGDNLTGITVHLAARVSALAASSEVLVSRTVRDLVAGAGFIFTDRGTHVLKGVEGEWQLFAASP